MPQEPASTTFLFTDIEGSTRLWEKFPAQMQVALARHDQIARDAIAQCRGTLVKSTGDGVHAAFDEAGDALRAALQMQLALREPSPAAELQLQVRCGLHAGTHQRRDNDFYGTEVNRAARVMSVAHGGQTLLSKAVADLVRSHLPESTSLRDLGPVRLRDLSRAEQVFQLVHTGLRADFPPLRSLESTPNNLAQQLNSYIGRERETAEVRALLHEHRLVTLLGMGGIGKSRLSVQLGAEVLDEYIDGVWLIELAPLADPRLVPQAVAGVLGLKEEGSRPLIDTLAAHVQARQMLVILDNCEHLLDACAELAKRLLQTGAGVKILASSRAPLQIAGESAYHVPTLTVPDIRQEVAPDSLTQHEAVRLFVDRARASQPAFSVTAGNAAAVAQICNRLDGIPLALELAAARTRTLSAEAIAERLNDRFRLLVTTDRTVLPRQRTLRALIDWSHDLLSAPEQALFRRLSVFAGGWTLAAAETVGAGGADVPPVEVMDLLSQLVEKSLVVMDADGHRYRMLDTVRQYAGERLAASADAALAPNQHLAYHVAFAEEARPRLAGPEQAQWLSRLDLERENLLAAHAWSEHADGGTEWALRLVHALRPYWINRGLMTQGHRMAVDLLHRTTTQQRDELRCRALFGAGQFCCFMGNYAEARDHLTEGLAIARETGNTPWIAGALQPLGMACIGVGDLDAARTHLEEAVVMAEALTNQRELAAAQNNLAQLYRMEGQLEAAQPLYESMVDLARAMGDKENIAVGLLNLTMVCITQGDTRSAPPKLLEVLGIAAEIGSKPSELSALEVCAGLAFALSLWPQGARFIGMAQTLAGQTGLQRDPADEAFLSPLMGQAVSVLGEAEFESRADAARHQPLETSVAEAGIWLQAMHPTTA